MEQLLEPLLPPAEPARIPAELRIPERGAERSCSPVSDWWAWLQTRCAGPCLLLWGNATAELRGGVGDTG